MRAKSGRMNGGNISIGEMELQKLWGSGLVHYRDELVLRGDTMSVEICLGCRRICMLCECEAEDLVQGTAPVRLTRSAVEIVTRMRVYDNISVAF